MQQSTVEQDLFLAILPSHHIKPCHRYNLTTATAVTIQIQRKLPVVAEKSVSVPFLSGLATASMAGVGLTHWTRSFSTKPSWQEHTKLPKVF